MGEQYGDNFGHHHWSRRAAFAVLPDADEFMKCDCASDGWDNGGESGYKLFLSPDRV